MEQLPVIDFSSPDRLANARDLVSAMETVGFVYLDNVPGFDRDLEERLHKASDWFFSLPLEDKLRLSPKKWNEHSTCVYRGYVPVNVPENHLREQFEMGGDLDFDDPDRNSGNPLYEPTAWPPGEEGEVFHRLMMSHYDAMIDAGMEFLRLTAIGLGMDEHTFDRRFLPKSVSSLRIMHYPTYGDTTEPTLTCEEHFDSTFVTLLVTFSYSGLEILKEDGQWMAVEPRPGSLVVNIGDLLSRMTSRRFKATQHRVQDIGKDRFSVPFFFEPRSDSMFEFPGESETILYGAWILRHLRRHKYQFGHLPDLSLPS